MTKYKLEITPSVTVHRLLEAYPELEDVLIGIAPPFKKLKNPMLRKSVAKIATLKHASSVGGVPLNELIDRLRAAVGQIASIEEYEDINYFTERPDWFDPDYVVLSIDERDTSDSNEMTLGPLLRGARDLAPGEVIELITTFLPAPGIDVMHSKGFSSWSFKDDGGLIHSCFKRKSE